MSSREWWRRVKDYADEHNITFEEAKNLGAGGKCWSNLANKKPFTLGGKVIKTKYVCESCGRESKICQHKCSFCGQPIIKKVVIDK